MGTFKELIRIIKIIKKYHDMESYRQVALSKSLRDLVIKINNEGKQIYQLHIIVYI